MKLRTCMLAVSAVAALALCLVTAPAGYAQKKGGTLVFTIPASGYPSMDGHQETTFAVVHAIAPMYSLLIRVDPTDPTAKKYAGDLAESYTISPDKKTYTFKLHQNAMFSDGSKLTSRDVLASYKKMMTPPEGVISPRAPYFDMVDSITAPDAYTVVFKLKYPAGAFMGVVANPFNWIYKADIIEKDPNWYKTNVLGSGPFVLKEQNPGANWIGVRNPKYYQKNTPYLDSYEAIYTPKEVVEIQAMRSGRSMIQFRGFPPAAQDQIKQDLGANMRVQESAWNCGLYFVPNSFKKPFDDVRVRRALNLAVDRWSASETLSKIAIVKTVGGLVFPGHELAMTDAELEKNLQGYSRNIEASRKEAKALLKAAGVPEGFKFKLHNRNTDQPYKIVGTWLIDQWRQVGLNVEQWVEPTGPFYATLRAKTPTYDVTIDFNCQTVVNPQVDVSQFTSKSDANAGHYVDQKIDDMYDRQLREADPAKVKQILTDYQKYIINEKAFYATTLWWNRQVVSNTKVQGWNVSPSHYINNQLDTVWLQ